MLVAVILSQGFDLPTVRAQESAFRILSHDLTVTIAPPSHRLQVLDRVTLQMSSAPPSRIVVLLNKRLVVAWVSREGSLLSFQPRPLPAPGRGKDTSDPDPNLVHEIVIEPDRQIRAGEKVVLDFDYTGEVKDLPKEPRQLRFVTPSETSGYIGPEGVYIGPETAWYPDVRNSLASYRVTVKTPPMWETVGQGKLVKREVMSEETITTWDTRAPAEGLTLAVGQFTVTTRPCDTIETATYLYPEDAALADIYLTAACQYLQAYSRLLGPYPFPRFSVVENFFASGLGMPSYTLLGAGSIRRRYIQPYALGHEIVHSWLGNYVYNDHGGNWMEGLTTYLANYYWHELQGDTKQAREERRMMLMAYAVYVPPDQDFPVAQFKHKADQRDSAIGYSKAAMVFHMLRREIGDPAFFGALKRVVAEYGGRRTGWRDLEAVFTAVAGRNLRPFFARWVEQTRTVDVAASTDPDFHVFRRIPRNDLPPMLNLFVTDPRRLVVLPAGEAKSIVPYRQIADRLAAQQNVTIASSSKTDTSVLPANSVLLLGAPSLNPVFPWARRGLPGGVQLGDNEFQVDGKPYRGDGMAVLFSFRNPDDPSHVVTMFYGLSDAATMPVAPLLFYYGWNSYVVFENGKVIARGDLEPRPR
jgi:hypothetical protein